MIEINLVPDVKQEFIRAKRVRTFVISTAVVTGIGAVAVVALLAVYAFLGQTVRSNLADSDIKNKSDQLSKVDDLGNTLTIQNQLSKLNALHDKANVSSRFFELLAAISPSAPNQVTFSIARMDSDINTVHLEGQAVNGYNAADALKKTILGTSLTYRDVDGQAKTIPLTESVSTSELSYGEDSTGKKVLRFTLTFEFDPVFFARTTNDATIVRPNHQNVTDSFLHLPESLFSDRITDQEGEN